MVQPNRRGPTRRVTTHLELHNIAWTHNDCELGRILLAEQGLVIAVSGDVCNQTIVPVQVHPLAPLLLHTMETKGV